MGYGVRAWASKLLGARGGHVISMRRTETQTWAPIFRELEAARGRGKPAMGAADPAQGRQQHAGERGKAQAVMNRDRSIAWLPYRKPNRQSRMRLFCFSYAGGGASIFVRWIAQLAPDVEVCPVQLPGRENRLAESCLTDASDVAECATEALTPFFDMDFALFGHSLGALIAYEMAQRTICSGPRYLIVSGRRAPQIPNRESPTSHLTNDDFKKHLQKLKGTPKDILENLELMDLILPTIRADFQIEENYIRPPNHEMLNCQIVAFGGNRDDEVPEEHIKAWRYLTNGKFTLQMFDGDHFFINQCAHDVIEAISRTLRYSP